MPTKAEIPFTCYELIYRPLEYYNLNIFGIEQILLVCMKVYLHYEEEEINKADSSRRAYAISELNP